MRLSKTTNYAIRILLDCAASDGQLVKVAEISERRDVTLQNTFKIVHLLSRAGFLQAVRGRHGGVRLARAASEIRIGDVVRAMETMRLEIEGDPTETRAPERQLAAFDQLFDDALDAFITVLDGHTLQDMIKAKRKGAGTADQPQRRSKPTSKVKSAKAAHSVRRQQVGVTR
jgi:Rrf2 family nitric oxide-sensitive transcriptional repressor